MSRPRSVMIVVSGCCIVFGILSAPVGGKLAASSLERMRAGAWCYQPVPYNEDCTKCQNIDDPDHPEYASIVCTGGVNPYDCLEYTNLNIHYGTDCYTWTPTCPGEIQWYREESCGDYDRNGPDAECEREYVDVALVETGVVPSCPL